MYKTSTRIHENEDWSDATEMFRDHSSTKLGVE